MKESKVFLLLLGAVIIAKFWDLLWVPVFFDEAIYLYQAEQVTKSASNLFIAFHEGVQFPIMTWVLALLSVLTKPLVGLLLSGRAFSVALDIVSAFFVYLIGKKIASKRYGFLSALLYLSLPLTFLHSRFVMLESMTNMYALGAFYFITTSFESKKLRDLILVGVFILLAFSTKPLAIVYFPALMLTPLILPKKQIIAAYKKLAIIFGATVLIIASVMVPLSSYFSAHTTVVTGEHNLLWVNFKISLHESWLWIMAYASPLLLIVAAGSVLKGLQQKNLFPLWLSFWIGSVIILDSLVGSHFYPRHLYPLAAPLALLAAYSLPLLFSYKKWLGYALALLLLVVLWAKNVAFLTSPISAMVGEDRQQFYEDWSSGVGLEPLAQKLKELSLREPSGITVYVEDDRLTSWALPQLFDLGNATTRSINTIPTTLNPNEYVVINRNAALIKTLQYEQVATYKKYGNRAIYLYSGKSSQ